MISLLTGSTSAFVLFGVWAYMVFRFLFTRAG